MKSEGFKRIGPMVPYKKTAYGKGIQRNVTTEIIQIHLTLTQKYGLSLVLLNKHKHSIWQYDYKSFSKWEKIKKLQTTDTTKASDQVLLPAVVTTFCLLQNVLNDSEVYPGSNSAVPISLFSGTKAIRAKNNHSLPSRAEGKNEWRHIPTPPLAFISFTRTTVCLVPCSYSGLFSKNSLPKCSTQHLAIRATYPESLFACNTSCFLACKRRHNVTEYFCDKEIRPSCILPCNQLASIPHHSSNINIKPRLNTAFHLPLWCLCDLTSSILRPRNEVQ